MTIAGRRCAGMATSYRLRGKVMIAGLGWESQMTIEAALSLAGTVLVFAFLWQSHRVTSRRLSQIQSELNALRDVISRIFLIQMAQKTKNEPPLSDEIPPRPSSDSTKTTDRLETNDAL